MDAAALCPNHADDLLVGHAASLGSSVLQLQLFRKNPAAMDSDHELDWKTDPAIKVKRKQLAQLYKQHTDAVSRKDTRAAGRLVTQINGMLADLGIKSPRQIGL